MLLSVGQLLEKIINSGQEDLIPLSVCCMLAALLKALILDFFFSSFKFSGLGMGSSVVVHLPTRLKVNLHHSPINMHYDCFSFVNGNRD